MIRQARLAASPSKQLLVLLIESTAWQPAWMDQWTSRLQDIVDASWCIHL